MTVRLQPALIRGARGMLNWSLMALADAADVSVSTVKRMEMSERQPVSNESYALVRAAFGTAGVLILDDQGNGPGLRLVKR